MSKYIGRDNPYGMFEIQDLTNEVTGSKNEFDLTYTAPSVGSLLVVYNGTLVKPNDDYALSNGGRTIVFSLENGSGSRVAPVQGLSLYIVYLGRELAVPAVAGNRPHLFQATGTGIKTKFRITDTPVPNITLTKHGILVYKDGVQQRFHDVDSTGTVVHQGDFKVSGDEVEFLVAPVNDSKLDFYVLGIERTDLVTVDPGSISSSKLGNGAVTPEKLNLYFKSYTPTFSTFNGMLANATKLEAEYQEFNTHTKVRLKFRAVLSGTVDNKIRFSLPKLNNGSTLVEGSATLTTDTSIEAGIVRWGSSDALDIYRQFGVNFSADTYVIEVVAEYKNA